MNKQSRLDVIGEYPVPPNKKNNVLYKPQMCVKVENKTSFVDQTITLTTYINKGKQYPYASTRQSKTETIT